MNAHARVRVPSALLLALPAVADADELTEGFESGWPAASLNNIGAYTNNGWIVRGRIPSGVARTGTRAAALRESIADPQVRTPLLVNGVGTFSFWYRNTATPDTRTYRVDTSTNGTDWVLGTPYTTASTTYANRTITYNIYDPVYVRIYGVDPIANNKAVLIDDIQVTDPPARVTLASVRPIPDTPPACWPW
jgi:hypothetical protein